MKASPWYARLLQVCRDSLHQHPRLLDARLTVADLWELMMLAEIEADARREAENK